MNSAHGFQAMKMEKKGCITIFALFVACLPVVESVCNSAARSCSSCIDSIQNDELCGWCTDQNFVGPRCASLTYLNENRCYNQENSSSEVLLHRNEPLNSLRPRLIAPQQIALNVKAKREKVTEIEFRAMAMKRSLIIKVSYPKRKFRVTVTSRCRFRWRANGRGRCSQTRRKDMIYFKMQITVINCDNGNGRITVSIPGNTQDKLNIDVRSSCACDCEKEENKVISSPVCRGGNLTCGVCDCSEGHFGQNCECAGEFIDTCRSSSDSPGPVCSGRGRCVCGICECQDDYTGQYCECNDYNCDVFNNALCGGSDRGVCRCGECQCRPGYVGTACEVIDSTDNCIASNGVLCNGHGTCEYNICRCSGDYLGRTCEECPTCRGQCEILKPCIECTAFSIGQYNEEECYYQCRQYGITTVDSLQDGSSARLCMFRDEDGCLFRFNYRLDEDGEPVVKALRRRECPSNRGF